MLLLSLLAFPATPVPVAPVFLTDAVGNDADDPAVWVNRRDRARSVIIGTNKMKAPSGALVVFDLDGKTLQTVSGLDRPNNVDVFQGFRAGRERWDLAVTTERLQNRLRIFRIVDGRLADVTGNTPTEPEPMGIALGRYNGAVHAVVSPKTGPSRNYLAEYRLTFREGKVDLVPTRRFGDYSRIKEIESLCVDDEAGFIYYSDERYGTRKLDLRTGKNVNVWDRTGFGGDHEGIAIWRGRNGTGYVVCTDQLPGDSVYHVFRREGENAYVGAFSVGADETDGIEVSSANLGPKFPRGIFLAMNSGPRNFVAADWRAVERALATRR